MTGVYTIPSGYSFLESLAMGLLEREIKDPFGFSQIEIFLPTRRACIELTRAFIRQGKGRCLLLPQFSLLGDLDEEESFLTSPQDEHSLSPLIPPFKRLGLLTKLIEDYTKKSELPSSPALSLKLAKSLIRLMDQAAIEKVDWDKLSYLVPSEFASHWQLTLNFLEIMTTHWPKILEAQGVIEPYTRHHRLVEALLSRWEKTPPSHSIIAAGSTGTMPATAHLLQAIAFLPQGVVILPGFDTSLREDEAEKLSPCHPQYAPTRFIKKMNLLPADVPSWPGLEGQEGSSLARARLFREAMKPSFEEHSSRTVKLPKALEGVYQVSCASPQDEALAIAILLRQHLETPHQRIALITSDLKLVERVTEELKRWNIDIDSSSGERLDQTPPGIFLKLCAEFAASPHDQVRLLSLLKHPLFHFRKPVGALRSDIRQFEKKVLRGDSFKIVPWLQEFQTLMRPFQEITKGSFETLLEIHIRIAEALSIDEAGICQLWKGTKGDALKVLYEEVKKASVDFPSLSLTEYPSLLTELLLEQRIRFRPQKHPRLAILGPLEARLFHADVMILGGLNEGTWPPDIGLDPWLNRAMRQEMGFPSPERRVGLSSHDFGQAFACPKVYLTRALKIDGTPTLACRWLERLEVYLKAKGLTLPEEPRVLDWIRILDQPETQEIQEQPLPIPPLETRPRRLSVTQIETWMRDPYALYARMILSLAPLNPLNAQETAADRGTLIHQALDQFFKICPDPYHKNALDILLFIGKTLFEPYEHNPSVRLFWWPRFCHLASGFIEQERRTRFPDTQTFTEVKGKLTLETYLGPFECTAKADRIDLLPDGRLRILDYKTGTSPSDQDVHLGFSPQLPLEGAIAMSQGFEGIAATHIESLQFWELKGDAKGPVIKTLPGNPHDLAAKARAGLERMIHFFEDKNTPYPARPLPTKGLKYNDYAHLERLQEWGRF